MNVDIVILFLSLAFKPITIRGLDTRNLDRQYTQNTCLAFKIILDNLWAKIHVKKAENVFDIKQLHPFRKCIKWKLWDITNRIRTWATRLEDSQIRKSREKDIIAKVKTNYLIDLLYLLLSITAINLVSSW